jgi:hypothetical protein
MYRKFKPPFFRSEQYRRTGESSIPFLFDENPGVAFAGLDGAAVGGRAKCFRSRRSLELRPSGGDGLRW